MAEQIKADKQTRWLHHLMAVEGGFLCAYALVNRLDTFGSSATSNLAHLFIALLGHDWPDFFIRVGAVLVYLLGLSLSVVLPLLAEKRNQYMDLRLYAVLLDVLGLAVLHFLPQDMDHLLALYPILFITAFQWNTFSTAKVYNSATIFSTNNLRQCCSGLIHFLLERDREQLKRFRFFGATLICYHFGVVYGYFTCRQCGVRAAFAGLLPLLPALWLILSRGDDGRESGSGRT